MGKQAGKQAGAQAAQPWHVRAAHQLGCREAPQSCGEAAQGTKQQATLVAGQGRGALQWVPWGCTAMGAWGCTPTHPSLQSPEETGPQGFHRQPAAVAAAAVRAAAAAAAQDEESAGKHGGAARRGTACISACCRCQACAGGMACACLAGLAAAFASAGRKHDEGGRCMRS